MSAMLSKMISFVVIIILGYVIKKMGVIKEKDAVIISHLVLKVTLPAYLITAANGLTLSLSLLPFIFLAIGATFLVNLLAWTFNKNEPGKVRGIAMINASGYNLGLFLMPIVSGIFSKEAILYLIFFDIGNSLMVFGGNNALASAQVRKSNGSLAKQILNHCLHSVPFIVYLILIVLSLFSLALPSAVIDIAAIPASANSFLCMALIGIKLNFNLDFSALKTVFKTLVAKYGANLTVLAGFMLFPLPQEFKLIIALALVTPTPVISVIYSLGIDPDSNVPPVVATLSTLVSLGLMFALLIVFN